MADKKTILYAYPCTDCTDCLEFLESGDKMTFREFCLSRCSKCADAVWLDIPYDENEGAI